MSDRRDFDVGDGLALHVEVGGTGPAVVLLHGFTGSGATWAKLARRLQPRFTTVAVDLPGHGKSSAPHDPARYALSRFADDLAFLLDALALDRAAMLGYSLGGRAALHFALRHAARLSALVLESASPGIAAESERLARGESDADLAAFIEREGVEAFVNRWERLPLWASQAELPGESRASLRAQRLRNVPHGLANSLRGAGAGATEPVLDRLGVIDAPTLLIAGALDTKYATGADAMAGAIPRARAAIVDGVGHAVHFEQPGEFGSLVEEFLEEHATGRN